MRIHARLHTVMALLAAVLLLAVFVLTTHETWRMGVLNAVTWSVPLFLLWLGAGLMRLVFPADVVWPSLAINLAGAVLFLITTVVIFWNYQHSSGMGYAFVLLTAGGLAVVFTAKGVLIALIRLHMQRKREAEEA